MTTMRSLLEKKLFPFVIKPGRYTGGETGQIIKDPAGRVSYLHIYPDKYEIGQSHVGLQIIYNIVNKDDRFLCERAFAVDTDAEQLMRERDIPFFSLESSRPAADFDLIGFSLVDETVYTNMLNCLDLAGIALRSKDRQETDPLIIAGGPAVFNPEPIAEFVDLFYIGDAEQGLPNLLAVIHENRNKGASRDQLLEAVAREVESVYIPRFYGPDRKPLVDFAPHPIVSSMIRDLKPEYYPDQPIVPLIETIQSHLAVEIMRGCPQGCRYCMARAVYQPTRTRQPEEITAQIEKQLAATGYNEVTLLSLSSSDYPKIEQLALPLARKLEAKRVSITLPSLRPGSISPGLLDAVKRVRRFGLTIAPEAGTERLRTFLRKNIPDEAIIDTVRLAFEKGWTTIKMYFMVGLPSETQEDIQGIVDLCRKIFQLGRQYDGRKTINVTLSPFVPKPHTPFQWDQAEPEKEVYAKINWIKNQIRPGQVNFKHNSTQLAQLIAVVSRGDRSMADAIETVYKNGARFDGWSESFEWDNWLKAFQSAGIDPAQSIKAIPFSTDLPWSHIAKGQSTEHLIKERERTSMKLREYKPIDFSQTTDSVDKPVQGFGRSRKKIASRNPLSPTKNRVRIRWGKTARSRFLSHLDNMRMIEMAMRRAELPIVYSQGYNPAPKISFGPPLSLGMTSDSEFIDIMLTSTFTSSMAEKLGNTMSAGFFLAETKTVVGNPPSLSARLNRAAYELDASEFTSTASLNDLIHDIMSKETLVVERTSKKGLKQIDIRPGLFDLRFENDRLSMQLGIGEGIFVRPSEVISYMTDLLSCDIPALAFHRSGMFRLEEDGRRIAALEL